MAKLAQRQDLLGAPLSVFVSTFVAVERFLSMAELRDGYLNAVKEGQFDAPPSDAVLAKTALAKLGAWLEEQA